MSEPQTFAFDLPDFLVGTAEYPEGPTGCTVFRFEQAVPAAVDIKGGATALRESSSLHHANSFGLLDALFFAGGSTYGLDVGTGVMEELRRLRGHAVGLEEIPSVPGAAVYDFEGRSDPTILPDAKLGARACREAKRNEVRVGRTGAGANVHVGSFLGIAYSERSGQGAAFQTIGRVRIFALSVVNALGNVLDRTGTIVAGSRDPATGRRISVTEGLRRLRAPEARSPRHTTLTAVITNVALSHAELRRLAAMAHVALGRVVEPFATPLDGDTLFAVSTSTCQLPKSWTVAEVGVFAAEVAQDAVLDAVTRDRSAP